MTNFEFYKEKLLQMEKENHIAGAVRNGQLKFCNEVDCLECELYDRDGDSCYINFWKWLASEHVDKPKLTKQEKTFCELLDPNYYIARDDNDDLFLFHSKPIKEKNGWGYEKASVSFFINDGYFSMFFKNVHFDFIKWEDTEPWKVADLLELEVENDLQTYKEGENVNQKSE